MHLREVVSNAARNLEVVRRAEKFFDCTRLINCCFNAYACSAWIIVPPCGYRRGVSFGFA